MHLPVTADTVRAVVMNRADGEIRVQVQEFPRPDAEAGAVLLRTVFSEVCGTDVHLREGRLAGVPYPIIPGHINVGVVEETGGRVSDIEGVELQPGDTVTFLDVHETCHNCWFCLVAKASTRCPNRKVYGITYPAEEGLLGGWSEMIYLKPGVKIVKLPPGLTAVDFIGGGCGSPTALHAVDRAGIRLDDSVVVQGFGPVGMSAAAFALLSGAGQVIVVEPSPERSAMAQLIGVDRIVSDADAAARVGSVLELTSGRGADVTIEASGSAAAVPEGMNMTRDNGTYVVVGQYTDSGEVSVNPHLQINRKHLDLRGVWGIDYGHFHRAVRLMAKHNGRFHWRRFVSSVYSMEDAGKALDDVAARRVMKAVIAPNGDQP